MENNSNNGKLIMNIIFAGLLVFSILGVGQIIMMYFGSYGLNVTGTIRVSDTAYEAIRGSLLLAFVFALIATIACAAFIALKFLWEAENKKVAKFAINIGLSVIVLAMLIGLFVVFGGFHGDHIRTWVDGGTTLYSGNDVTFATQARGSLAFAIPALTGLVILMITFTICHAVKTFRKAK